MPQLCHATNSRHPTIDTNRAFGVLCKAKSAPFESCAPITLPVIYRYHSFVRTLIHRPAIPMSPDSNTSSTVDPAPDSDPVVPSLGPYPTPSDIDLIITDVDGTLLTSTHTIHPRTLNAFRAIRKIHPDLPIVIASGKQYESCQFIRDMLELDDPAYSDLNSGGEFEGEAESGKVDGGKRRRKMERFPAIHCNGSLIYAGGTIQDLSSPSSSPSSPSPSPPLPHPPPPPLVSKTLLSPATVNTLVSSTKPYGTFLFTPSGAAILVNAGEGVNQKDWCEIAGRYDSNVRDCSGEEERKGMMRDVNEGKLEVVKVTVCVDESDLDDSYAILSALASPTSQIDSPITLTRAIPFIYEYIPATSSKSFALTLLSHRLGVPLGRILAFGDGENDEGMLMSAGWGVVMGNGMEVVRRRVLEAGVDVMPGLDPVEGEDDTSGTGGDLGGLASVKVGGGEPEKRRRRAIRGKYLTGTNDEGGVGMFLEKVWGLV